MHSQVLTKGVRYCSRCKTCRKRKTRCSGEKPVCTTCKQTGQECLGYTEPTPRGAYRHARRDSRNNPAKDEQAPGPHSAERGSRLFGPQARPHQRHASQPAVLPSHLILRGISPRNSQSPVRHMPDAGGDDEDGNGESRDQDLLDRALGMADGCESPELTCEKAPPFFFSLPRDIAQVASIQIAVVGVC